MSFEISNMLHRHELLFAFTEKVKTTAITKPTQVRAMIQLLLLLCLFQT